MNSSDRILLLNHFNLLSRDEKNQPVWRNHKILVIQSSILFFPSELTQNGGTSTLFFNELCNETHKNNRY